MNAPALPDGARPAAQPPDDDPCGRDPLAVDPLADAPAAPAAATGSRPAPIQRHWWAKSLAGAVLGLGLGIAAGGLYARFTSAPPMISAQIAMWLTAPVWMTVLSLVFLFRSGWRAWGWLLAANGLAYGVLAASRLWAG